MEEIYDLVDNLNYDLVSAGTYYYYLVSDEYNDFFLANGYDDFWTMIPYQDSKYNVLVNVYSNNVLQNYAVRPVVNVDKCAIDGGCDIKEIQVEDGCIEDIKAANVSNNPVVSVFTGINNPDTGDNIIVYVFLLVISMIYLTITCISLKNKNMIKD